MRQETMPVFVDVQDVMIKSYENDSDGWVSIGGVTPQAK
jgi:hypothetical protein